MHFHRHEEGFTGAEKALLICIALAIILLVSALLRGGAGSAAGDAKRVLEQGSGPVGSVVGIDTAATPRAAPAPPPQQHHGGRGLGNPFGWVADRAGDAKHWAGDRVGDATSALGGAKDWAGDRLGDAGSWLGDRASDAGSWLGDRASDAKGWLGDRVSDALPIIRDAAGIIPYIPPLEPLVYPLLDHRTHQDYLDQQAQAASTIQANLHPNDMLVAFGGTGNDLSGQITRDGQTVTSGDITALNASIAAAQASGQPMSDFKFAAWGYNIDSSVHSFQYLVPGTRDQYVTVYNLGGANSAVHGPGPAYDVGNLSKDSADFRARLAAARNDPQDFPGLQGANNLVPVGHSWGGAIVEDQVRHLQQDSPGMNVNLAITAGVPAKVLGPGYHNYDSGVSSDNGVKIVEVNRPDDPVHGILTKPPVGPWLQGHDYNIKDSSGNYRGFYGITDPGKLYGGRNLPTIAQPDSLTDPRRLPFIRNIPDTPFTPPTH